MSLQIDSIEGFALGDELNLFGADSITNQFGAWDTGKLKRPRSPIGINDHSRCISDGDCSDEGSISECHAPSSLHQSRSSEDFSFLLSCVQQTSFSSMSFDDQFDGDASTEESCASYSAQSDEMSAKRRKRMNLLVPYPRIPRTAEYQCSNCSHAYSRVVADNPWWAVYRHDCPACNMSQVPRIDIMKDENAIEIDPNVLALYGEGVDESGDEGDDEDDATEVSSDSNDMCFESKTVSCSPCFDCEGRLGHEEASKLLVLMCHAKTCDGQHVSAKHAKVCKSTKLMMMHLRDCTLEKACNVSWCAPAKLMLQHISCCPSPYQCTVCTPKTLSNSFQQLHNMNQTQNSNL